MIGSWEERSQQPCPKEQGSCKVITKELCHPASPLGFDLRYEISTEMLFIWQIQTPFNLLPPFHFPGHFFFKAVPF